MIRNLLYLFKRFKTAVVLNLFGLTIAFAAFLLIVMQVDYEMNYDAMHSKSGRTFRLISRITPTVIHSTEENGIAKSTK